MPSPTRSTSRSFLPKLADATVGNKKVILGESIMALSHHRVLRVPTERDDPASNISKISIQGGAPQ